MERLAWSEIKAWSEVSHVQLGATDGALIFAMSKAFVGGFRSEKAPHDPVGCKIALASAMMEAEYAKATEKRR